jgi:hypothetical protein
MDRNVFRALLATAGVLLMAMPVRAHHSGGAYDENKPVTLTGVIAEVRLTNPHSWFYIDVTDESGKVTRWGFEAAIPASLIRSGFKRDSLTVGDKVTIKGSRARDLSANMGSLQSITMTDQGGRLVVVYGREP